MSGLPAGRALCVIPRLPSAQRDRGSARALDHASALAGRGWEVVFASVHDEPDSLPLAAALRQQGFEVEIGVGDRLRERARAGEFELVVASRWVAAERIAAEATAGGAAFVVDSVDVHFLRHARYRAAGAADVHERNVDFFGREVDAYAAADVVLAVSQGEADLLRSLLDGHSEVALVPLAAAVASGEDGAGPSGRRGMLFVGSYRHVPNTEAVEQFSSVVLPRLAPSVLARHPLRVLGSGLPSELSASLAAMPGVVAVGWVPDLGPELDAARVSVAPLLHGAGVKGKVLEAMAAGLPVVGTPVAFEGLAVTPGVDALVASAPWEWAEALERLFDDDGLWRAVSDAGRAYVGAHHDPAAAADAFLAAVDRALSPSRRPATLRWGAAYAATVVGLAEEVVGVTPPGAEVLVVSGGDEAFLDVVGRTCSHFPQGEDGRHAGFHPVNGDAALAHLQGLIDRGASYLAVPATAQYWLHAYPELAAWLAGRKVLRGRHTNVYRLAEETPVVALIAPADLLARVEQRPPATCRIEPVEWSGGPVPELGLCADLCVLARPGATFPPGFLDQLVAVWPRAGLSLAQPALVPSAGVPPAYHRVGGVDARLTDVHTEAPVLVFRSDARHLVEALLSGDGDHAHAGSCCGVLDAVAVEAPGAVTEATARAKPALRGIVTSRGRCDIERQAGAKPPALSVVIATFERPALLRAALESFARQRGVEPSEVEVVVVDDGSRGEGTAAAVAGTDSPFATHYLRADHAGRSGAKNLGVLAASGEIVLFFDDDDVADVDLCATHLAFHREHPDPPLAVLGHTSWAPELTVSPVMHYLTDVGMTLFSYVKIPDGAILDYRYFWEGRVSCKRAFLLDHGLHDERLDYTIDIELAYRLASAGLKVAYLPAARSFMARPVELAGALDRAEGKGRAAATFASLHPDPAVRDYCQTERAEQTWARLGRDAEAVVRRALAAEAALRGRSWDEASPELLEAFNAACADALAVAFAGGVVRAAPLVPEVSIIVAVHNTSRRVAAVVADALLRVRALATVATELIVVDNGSPTPADLAADVRVDWPANRGVSAAWNAGAGAASGRVLVFFNSDVRVETGWDRALADAATSGRRIAFPFTDHCDGAGFRVPDKAGCAGWCFAVSAELHREIGPFDERFSPAYFEDTDYFHRAFGLGVALTPVSGARVRHARRTTARDLPWVDTVFERNRRQYEAKHGMPLGSAPPYWHREIVTL